MIEDLDTNTNTNDYEQQQHFQDEQQCHLVTDTYSKIVQVILGFIAISTLYVKREIEEPSKKRPLLIWFLDVSKQGFGAFIIHFWNILLSMMLANSHTQTTNNNVDECSVYIITFAIDVFIGTYIIYLLLAIQKKIAISRNWTSLIHSGVYHDENTIHNDELLSELIHDPTNEEGDDDDDEEEQAVPNHDETNPAAARATTTTKINYCIWFKQLLAWIIINILMKIIISFFIAFVLIQPITIYGTRIAMFIFGPNHRHLELLIVMIVGPCILNLLQFWIIDSFIKKNTNFHTPIATSRSRQEQEDERVRNHNEHEPPPVMEEDEDHYHYDPLKDSDEDPLNTTLTTAFSSCSSSSSKKQYDSITSK